MPGQNRKAWNWNRTSGQIDPLQIMCGQRDPKTYPGANKKDRSFNRSYSMCGWRDSNPDLRQIKRLVFQPVFVYVRVIGLEPTCLTASDPKSDTSANFAHPL